MRAALLRAFNEPLVVEELEPLPLAARRVLIRTHASAFCSTDVSSHSGRLGKVPPTILGHSSVGEVIELGAGVEELHVGQRVVVPGTPECGECYYCGIGRPDQCAELFDLGGIFPHVADTLTGEPVSAAGSVGGYSDLMNVSAHQAFAVQTELPSDVLSLLGCGITTGVGAVVNVARVQPGESVVVVGCGHLGLWTLQAARLAQASPLIAVEPIAARRALAAQWADVVIDPEAEDAVEVVRGLTAGRGADTVLETAGPPEAQRLALSLSRRAGTVVFSGLATADAQVTLPQVAFAVQSRSLLSTQNGNVRMRRDLPRYVHLLEEGLLDAAPIISNRYRLEEINDALDASRARTDLSGVVLP